MHIPTAAIIPPLLGAFAVLGWEHYRTNPEKPVRDFRFLMMVAALLMMFGQLGFGYRVGWVSPVLFVLALVWVGVAVTLLRARLRAH